MQNIYDTLAKLNKVANAPEIVKEDNNALMKKGLEDLMRKTKFNKDADYKPFGKGDKDYETGLPKDAKKDKMFDDMAAADAAKMNKSSTYTPFSDKQSPDGLPEKKKDDKMFEGPGGQSKHELIRQLFKSHFGQPQYNELTGGASGMRRLKIITGTSRPGYTAQPVDTSNFEKAIGKAGLSGDVRVKSDKDGYAVTVLYPDQFRMQSLGEAELVEKESDVERDDRAEKAGREVKRDAKYDDRRHAGKDGKSVTKDIEYDEKHDKDGMHEADINEISNKTIDSYMDKVGQEDGHEQDMETASSKRGKGVDLATAKQLGTAKVKATENAGTLKDAARQGVMARLAELAGIPAQEIEEALGTPQDIADKIMHENPIEEAEVEEGNEFSGERDKAIKAGKNDFTVDGKTYPVKGDKNESLEEADDDSDMPSKAHIEKMCKDGKTKKEICDMHPDCDQGKLKKMIDDCADHMDESEINEGVKDMMQDVEEGMDKAEFEKKYPGQDYDGIKKDIEDRMDETTSSGSVATGDGAGKPLFKNASIYEKYEGNEIAQRAFQINEDMSFTVSGGPDQEPTLNINASGAEAQQLGQLLKLSGLGMQPAAPQYGEVEIQVAEDQEFANGADDQNTMDTQYMTQDIAGGLNGPKKMAYPKVAGADNPMSVLGESELNEVGEERLMKLYQEYKAK